MSIEDTLLKQNMELLKQTIELKDKVRNNPFGEPFKPPRRTATWTKMRDPEGRWEVAVPGTHPIDYIVLLEVLRASGYSSLELVKFVEQVELYDEPYTIAQCQKFLREPVS